jgi:hypothetical protein
LDPQYHGTVLLPACDEVSIIQTPLLDHQLFRRSGNFPLAIR